MLANFEDTFLREADLQGGHVLANELCEATTLYKAELNPDIPKLVKKQCPELLVEPPDQT